MGRLLAATEVTIEDSKDAIPQDALPIVCSKMTAYVPLSEIVDKEAEIARLTAEREKAVSELKRAEGMLANPNFVNRAPAAKVEAEKEKVVKYRAMLQEIDSQLQAFA